MALRAMCKYSTLLTLGHKRKTLRSTWTSHKINQGRAPHSKKNLTPPKAYICACAPQMSADDCGPLFAIDNNNDNNIGDDPNILRVQEQLVTAERLQQECMEQRRIERAQCQVEAEVEWLR